MTEPTRDRLLKAARDLFAEQGYQDASIQELLDRTGVSRGALYYHFATKQDLFEAVLERIESEIERALIIAAGSAAPGRDALRAGSLAWFSLAEDPEIRRIALIDAPNAVGWSRWREIDARHGFGLLRGALAAEAEAGRIAPEMVDCQAHVLLAALMELGLLIASADDRAATRSAAERAIDALLDGMLTR